MSLRIGINGGGGHAHVDDAIEHARAAATDGFPSYWLSQIFGVDALTTVALIAREVPELELGVTVVPTYPRHPTALAVQAQTVQQAAGGRLVLGIGPSHAPAVEGMWGLDWSRPYSHTVEYLAILRDLLDGKAVNHEGALLTTRGQLTAAAARTPILIAGLGPRMLALAGGHADGTATWMCGLETLRNHIVPRVSEAAAQAGRPAPRIVAGLPLCVTDQPERARAHAAEKLALYGAMPSYRAMLDREGAEGPADICLIGDESTVAEGLDQLEAMGVSDLRATELDPTPEDQARTRALLRSRLHAAS
jgi:F420-dependent oxidoreductase-like protein